MTGKIIIIEDDEDILYSLKLMLMSAGYEVEGFASGKHILEGNFSTPNLMILDKRMPDMDGLELCRSIRKKFSTNVLPIIMLSASPKFGPEAIEAGANDFLSKPFEMNEFLRVVKRNIRY